MQSKNNNANRRGKNLKTSQWLNIVIIVISGLVLAFTLIGKFMDKPAKNNQLTEQGATSIPISNGIKKPLLVGIKIFDQNQQLEASLQLNPSGWKEDLLGGKSLTTEQIEQVGNQWRALINQPLLLQNDRQQSVALITKKVHLYFAEKSTPLIATINVSNNQLGELKTFIQFVSTQQLIVLPANAFKQLIPSPD